QHRHIAPQVVVDFLEVLARRALRWGEALELGRPRARCVVQKFDIVDHATPHRQSGAATEGGTPMCVGPRSLTGNRSGLSLARLAKEVRMGTVNMLEAKSTLSKLVQDLETGKEREIIIARNG